MRKSLLIVLVFLSSQLPGEAYAGRVITVSAASSLTDAFREIGAAFEKDTGIRAVFNFGASGALFKQIEAGAPVDVLASADETTMDEAEAKGLLIKKGRRDFAANELVLAVPFGSNKISGVKDLARATRISIANPDTAPAGRYAKQALMKMKLWDALEPKFIYCPNVRQALDYVRRGEVDAGFVFKTDAVSAKRKIKIACSLNGHARYPAAVVSASGDRESARKFIDFLSGPKAQAVLRKYGFRDVK